MHATRWQRIVISTSNNNKNKREKSRDSICLLGRMLYEIEVAGSGRKSRCTSFQQWRHSQMEGQHVTTSRTKRRPRHEDENDKREGAISVLLSESKSCQNLIKNLTAKSRIDVDEEGEKDNLEINDTIKSINKINKQKTKKKKQRKSAIFLFLFALSLAALLLLLFGANSSEAALQKQTRRARTISTSSRQQQSNACDKADCGPHASCQLDRDEQPICVCDAGYLVPNSGPLFCTDVNECETGITVTVGGQPVNGTRACGTNAQCTNKPGSYECRCPPGFVGNAHKFCSPAPVVRETPAAIGRAAAAVASGGGGGGIPGPAAAAAAAASRQALTPTARGRYQSAAARLQQPVTQAQPLPSLFLAPPPPVRPTTSTTTSTSTTTTTTTTRRPRLVIPPRRGQPPLAGNQRPTGDGAPQSRPVVTNEPYARLVSSTPGLSLMPSRFRTRTTITTSTSTSTTTTTTQAPSIDFLIEQPEQQQQIITQEHVHFLGAPGSALIQQEHVSSAYANVSIGQLQEQHQEQQQQQQQQHSQQAQYYEFQREPVQIKTTETLTYDSPLSVSIQQQHQPSTGLVTTTINESSEHHNFSTSFSHEHHHAPLLPQPPPPRLIAPPPPLPPVPVHQNQEYFLQQQQILEQKNELVEQHHQQRVREHHQQQQQQQQQQNEHEQVHVVTSQRVSLPIIQQQQQQNVRVTHEEEERRHEEHHHEEHHRRQQQQRVEQPQQNLELVSIVLAPEAKLERIKSVQTTRVTNENEERREDRRQQQQQTVVAPPPPIKIVETVQIIQPAPPAKIVQSTTQTKVEKEETNEEHKQQNQEQQQQQRSNEVKFVEIVQESPQIEIVQQRQQQQQQKTVTHEDHRAETHQNLTSYTHDFAYRQVSCSSALSCPGNLACLPGGQCGCSPGYSRLADFCLVAGVVECASSALCRAREECLSSKVIQSYYESYNNSTNTTATATTTTSVQQEVFGKSSSNSSQLSEIIERVDEYRGVCVCPRGFRLLASGLACMDVNECEEYGPCAQNAICRNRIGSFECVCPPGYFGDAYTSGCIKYECTSNSDCASDMYCSLDIHKCVTPCFVCGTTAICTPRDHVAICTCPVGLVRDVIETIYTCKPPPTTTTSTTTTTTTTSTTTTTTTTTTTPAPPSPETTTPEVRTLPPADLFVSCKADGVQVDVQLDGGLDGIMYVRGHSQDSKCRRLLSAGSSDPNELEQFLVPFGACGLIHDERGEAKFVLVVQRHPKLVTYRARAYNVKCLYETGERAVDIGLNVSAVAKQGTIANTGPPPSIVMSITSVNGSEISSAEVGQDLLLRIDVQPDNIYGGFARSCEAQTQDENGADNEAIPVTDSNGCALDPAIFSNFQYEPNSKTLVARFNAFKFPYSNALSFQCHMRVCFGKCPSVNCNGQDVLAPSASTPTNNSQRQRKRTITKRQTSGSREVEGEPRIPGGGNAPNDSSDTSPDEALTTTTTTTTTTSTTRRPTTASATVRPASGSTRRPFQARPTSTTTTSTEAPLFVDSNNANNSVVLITNDDDDDGGNFRSLSDGFKEGTLKEDIVVKSNTILTFEPKNAPILQETPQIEDIEFICMPWLGVILSILLTLLLASIALCIALSCWSAANKKPKVDFDQPGNSPLPHPSEFPNPLLRDSPMSTMRR